MLIQEQTAAVPPGDGLLGRLWKNQPISQPGATERTIVGRGVGDRPGLGVLDTQGKKEPKCQWRGLSPSLPSIPHRAGLIPLLALLTISFSPQHC